MDERYTTPGMCFAAFLRVRQGIRNGQVRDTMPHTVDEPLPPQAVDTARRCLHSRLVAATKDPRDAEALQNLALVVGEDSLALEVVDRRLALMKGPSKQWEPVYRYRGEQRPEATDEQLRHQLTRELLDGIFSVFLGGSEVPPHRDAAAARLLPKFAALGEKEGLLGRLAYHQHLREDARMRGDTTARRRELRAITALVDSMTAKKMSLPFERSQVMSQVIEDILILDSLPGTNAEVWPRQIAAVWQTYLPGQKPAHSFATAGTLPPTPLKGTFWFNAGSSTGGAAGTRPQPGKWSLVVRIQRSCDRNPQCYPSFAGLRRLHQRYGAKLDVTLVTHTQGFYLRQPPPTPAKEAEALREFYFDFLRLPGALTVTELKSLQLPPPDLRWVLRDRLENDDEGYTSAEGLGGDGPPSLPYAVLVDPAGRIMYQTELMPWQERDLQMLFDGLLR